MVLLFYDVYSKYPPYLFNWHLRVLTESNVIRKKVGHLKNNPSGPLCGSMAGVSRVLAGCFRYNASQRGKKMLPALFFLLSIEKKPW